MADLQFEQVELDTKFINVQPKSNKTLDSTHKESKRLLSEDREMVENELKNLSKLKDGISPVIEKISKSKRQSQSSIQNLRNQAAQLQTKISNYSKQLDSSNQTKVRRQIERNQKLYISEWQQRITLADELNVKKLADIEFEDRKSIGNELFKWIIVAIYAESQVKYYWPNFKEQLFEKDQGKDFKERLGKINATNAKQEQILKINFFLEKYPQIIECQELKDVLPQAQSLRKIAKIYLECHELAKKSVQLEASIQNDKQHSLKRDEQAMKWKAREQALQQRIEVIKDYQNTLQKTQAELNQKRINLQKKLHIAKQISHHLKKEQSIPQELLKSLNAKE